MFMIDLACWLLYPRPKPTNNFPQLPLITPHHPPVVGIQDEMKKGPADLKAEAEVERGTLAPTIELPLEVSTKFICFSWLIFCSFMFLGGFKAFVWCLPLLEVR